VASLEGDGTGAFLRGLHMGVSMVLAGSGRPASLACVWSLSVVEERTKKARQ
jgi:hypothetical protein